MYVADQLHSKENGGWVRAAPGQVFLNLSEVESDRATSSASPPWTWWAQLISWRLVVAITLPSLHHHQPRRQGHEG